ncbi:hypothetical protein BVRB_5g101700 [Beta vulgaris subsp. vulgaris]|uniref:uncharacterized protein LOC104892404 n=1 Tax=Beta vulgaris subsp. vulgaris TaxID=3555 RepID=UPI00053F3367|nr:uncharacterized protein LOC104892404 [Beta vulgaris subsp. vulgaris]KMT12224.1 hypothetical protein BVRB_5g101700 [Beta vulgaris subsp. vulgaris]
MLSIANFLAFSLLCFSTLTSGFDVDHKVLVVGKELFRETLPLRMGSRDYLLQGLKPYTWYEVKISYPASIPAMFSLQLKRGNSDIGMNKLRKLLNTEKLIFKAEDLDEINHQGGLYVSITVEPEGFVAIPGVQERESILFNIVCDELMLGIPHKAWLVAALALLCVVAGLIIPRFLPSFLLPKDQDLQRVGQLASVKDS